MKMFKILFDMEDAQKFIRKNKIKLESICKIRKKRMKFGW